MHAAVKTDLCILLSAYHLPALSDTPPPLPVPPHGTLTLLIHSSLCAVVSWRTHSDAVSQALSTL